MPVMSAASSRPTIARTSSFSTGEFGRTSAKSSYGFSITPMPALLLKSSNGSYSCSAVSEDVVIAGSEGNADIRVRYPPYRLGSRGPECLLETGPDVGRERTMPDQLNLALLILRLATGLMILAHAYNHVFRGGKIQGTGRWFASMGMKPGILHAWLASITEFVCGVLLLAGFLTPLAAGGVMGVVLVALVTAHRQNGFFFFKPGQGWEYVAYIASVCLALGTLGAGEWSLDNAFHSTFNGWVKFVVTLLVGVGGAAGLLAVFYRPEVEASAS